MAKLYIFFSTFCLAVIGVIFITALEINKISDNYSPQKLDYPSLISPTISPKIVEVNNKKAIATKSLGNVFLLDVKCPPNYGVRNIKCEKNSNEKNDIQLIGFNQNVLEVNQRGAYCQFTANSSFTASIFATCDKSYFNLEAYRNSNFFPGVNSSLPAIFELWEKETSEKVSDSSYKFKLTCPEGYSASDIRCDLDENNQTIEAILLKAETSQENNTLGECLYETKNPVTGTIRVNCLKE